jgi:hypothetical protein
MAEPLRETSPRKEPAKPRRAPSRRRPEPKPIDWEKITDEELLAKRICDLPLKLEGTEIEERINVVYGDLEAKGIKFFPKVYLGDEWFSPEGDPVISIPFYLAHARLIRLERNRVLDAEGATRSSFLRLLRHEMGHALDHAFKIYKFKGYERVFGSSAKPYPKNFRPRPYSKRYVTYLEDCYAQIHPDEDFAETFAVWLTPGSDWQKRYAGWPALKKLEWVERMMQEKICGKPPVRRSGQMWRRLSTIRMTIDHYHKIKHRDLKEDFPDFFDRDLHAIFGDEKGPTGERASKFLRRNRRVLVNSISKWTEEKKFTVHNLVTRFAERGEALQLWVTLPEPVTLTQTTACLTAMAKNYFLTGKFKRPK